MSQSLGCMQLNEKNHVPFLTFPRLDALPYITHAFSTRKGGVSQQEFSSMNLNFNRGDSDTNVLKNYHLFCDAVGFDFHKLVASAQDHHAERRRPNYQRTGCCVGYLLCRLRTVILCGYC